MKFCCSDSDFDPSSSYNTSQSVIDAISLLIKLGIFYWKLIFVNYLK